MKANAPFRLAVGAAALLLLAAAPVFARGQRMAPFPRRPGFYRGAGPPAREGIAIAAQDRGPRAAQNRANRSGIEQWMQNHRNLSPADQERALENDPSFRALRPQQQQRALNELRRLQTMTPQQLDRRGALLRMTPEQRQQFDFAVQQYTSLPPDRRLQVQQAFAALRRVPLPERQRAIDTYPPLRQFSPHERQVLGNLLFWEPYFADAAPGESR